MQKQGELLAIFVPGPAGMVGRRMWDNQQVPGATLADALELVMLSALAFIEMSGEKEFT